MIIGRVSRNTPLTDWHKWFAWRPVVILDGRIAWLETVQRRKSHSKDRWYWLYDVNSCS
jgi:hypothetical protein